MVGVGTSERIKRMNSMRVRLGLLVVLVLLVGPVLAQARPLQDDSPRMAQEPRLLEGVQHAWGWLVSMILKGGSFIDPNGIHTPTGTAQPDGGSFIDPNGGA
jgi:hypothetical protein